MNDDLPSKTAERIDELNRVWDFENWLTPYGEVYGPVESSMEKTYSAAIGEILYPELILDCADTDAVVGVYVADGSDATDISLEMTEYSRLVDYLSVIEDNPQPFQTATGTSLDVTHLALTTQYTPFGYFGPEHSPVTDGVEYPGIATGVCDDYFTYFHFELLRESLHSRVHNKDVPDTAPRCGVLVGNDNQPSARGAPYTLTAYPPFRKTPWDIEWTPLTGDSI